MRMSLDNTNELAWQKTPDSVFGFGKRVIGYMKRLREYIQGSRKSLFRIIRNSRKKNVSPITYYDNMEKNKEVAVVVVDAPQEEKKR